ncbi:MAG: hypothetical protein RLZZ422_1886 [Pseudomonadota bacterium]|jgi:hypothetical protein
MKFLKVFSLFIILQAAAWAGTHFYLKQHAEEVLVIVDTSFALKPQFSAMEDWINQFEAKTRYKTIVVGTDKALLGKLTDIKAKSSIFRTAFGRMTEADLNRYNESKAVEKILLSDGSIHPSGWKVIKFP